MCETHLSGNDTIDLPGYKWLGFNRQLQHTLAPWTAGGVGMFIKHDLYNSFDISIVDRSYDGILGVKFAHKVSKYEFIVFSCYLPPQNSTWGRDAVSFYSHLLSQIYVNSDCDVIISGDLNSRIGSLQDTVPEIDNVINRIVLDKTYNQHGQCLIDFLHESKLCTVNGRISNDKDDYTFIAGRGLSVVDYFLIQHDMLKSCNSFSVKACSDIIDENGLHGLINARSKPPDHALLSMTFNICLNSAEHSTCFTENDGLHTSDPVTTNKHVRYNVRHIPPEFLQNDLTLNALNLLIESIETNRETQNEIDTIYDDFVNIVTTEMHKCLPVLNSCNVSKRKYKPRKAFWNDDLNNAWNVMKNKEYEFKHCKYRHMKALSRAQFAQAQYVFDKKLRFYERNYRKEKLENIEKINTSNPRQFWEELKKLGPKGKKYIPMEVMRDGNIVVDRTEVLDKWKSDFESLYKNSDIHTYDSAFLSRIQNHMTYNEQQMLDPLYVSNNALNSNISLHEVQVVIDKCKNNKACGIDSIPYEILKLPIIVDICHHLFQLCFDSGKIPSMWYKAIIVPIPKGGDKDPRIPLNYRGISLLCCTAKLYSSMLNNRIMQYCEINDKLVDEQNGFRKNRSCEDHIFTLSSIVRNQLDNGHSTYAAFLDLQKAFDWVNRDLMLYKVNNLGIDGKMYFAVKSLYNDTKSCISLNEYRSDWFQCVNGVRQGDTLSPTLFAIFINDLVEELNNMGLGMIINGRHICALLYADDIVLISRDPNSLQKMLDFVYNWCNSWHLSINLQKSGVVHFRKPCMPKTDTVFKIGDNAIDIVDHYKYLGVIFDQYLNFNYNVDTLANSAGRALGSLISKYKLNKDMGIGTYTKFFDSCVAPILDYASGIWGFGRFEQCETIMNRAMRVYMGVHRFAPTLALQGDMGWLSCKTRRKLKIVQFWNHLVRLPRDRLTYKIFEYDYNRNSHNWSSDAHEILDSLNLETNFDELVPCNIDYVKQKLFESEQSHWKDNLTHKPKLRTYIRLKDNLKTANYVKTHLSGGERSVLAQIRCGILPLHIETGRFNNTPLEERLCTMCNNDDIEDELHFIFDCDKYTAERTQLFHLLRPRISDFDDLNNYDKFARMCDVCPRQFSKYLYRTFRIRKDEIYKHS